MKHDYDWHDFRHDCICYVASMAFMGFTVFAFFMIDEVL